MSANLTAALMGIVTGVVSARALGPDGRGELAVMILWPSLIATVVDLGISEAITLRTAKAPDAAFAHFGVGIWIALAGSVIGVLTGYAATPYLLRADQQQLLTDSYWAQLYIPLSLLANVSLGSLLGLQRFRAVAAVRIGTGTSYLVVMLLVVAAGYGSPRTLMLLTVASRGVPFPLCLPFLVSAFRGRGKAKRRELVEQLRDGAHQQMAKLAAVLSGAEDRALAALRLSSASIGHWQIASSMTVVMPFISQALSQQLYAVVATGTSDQAKLTQRAYMRSIALTGAVAALAVPILPLAIPLVYGQDFSLAVAPATIVTFAAVFGAGAMTLSAGARGAQRTGICVASEVAGIAAMGAIGWVLAQRYGGIGLAIAYLAGRMVSLLFLVAAWRTIGLRSRELLPPPRRFLAAVMAEWRAAVRVIAGR